MIDFIVIESEISTHAFKNIWLKVGAYWDRIRLQSLLQMRYGAGGIPTVISSKGVRIYTFDDHSANELNFHIISKDHQCYYKIT